MVATVEVIGTGRRKGVALSAGVLLSRINASGAFVKIKGMGAARGQDDGVSHVGGQIDRVVSVIGDAAHGVIESRRIVGAVAVTGDGNGDGFGRGGDGGRIRNGCCAGHGRRFSGRKSLSVRGSVRRGWGDRRRIGNGRR